VANHDSTIAVDQLQVRLDRASVICERDRPCQPPGISALARSLQSGRGALLVQARTTMQPLLSVFVEGAAHMAPAARVRALIWRGAEGVCEYVPASLA
jgi:hypothetical protein